MLTAERSRRCDAVTALHSTVDDDDRPALDGLRPPTPLPDELDQPGEGEDGGEVPEDGGVE